MFLTLLASCLVDAPFPDVGECADYPAPPYEYGQIGIGTCISGPVEMELVDDGVDPVLLVTNANPYQTFTGGSLLAIPWSQIEAHLGEGYVSVQELSPAAVDLPDFAGGLAVAGDLGLVAVRLSEESRTRAWWDNLYLIDLSDPSSPVLSDRGTDGEATVVVQSDPTDVVYDPGSGMAYVANRTSHSVSLVDLTSDPVAIVPPWPIQGISTSRFFDADRSGSTASLSWLQPTEDEDDRDLIDEAWTLDWVDGTWWVWAPVAGKLSRYTTNGDGVYSESGLGEELDPSKDDDIGEIRDPFYAATDPGFMYFASDGELWVAATGDGLADWTFDSSPLLSGDEGDWDQTMGGPAIVVDSDLVALFYDGSDGETSAIGVATSSDGLVFTRVGDPVLEPSWDHEAGGIADPFVFWDGQVDRWRMYYSARDGERWTIGHATSVDLAEWASDSEPVFAIDGVDVAAPAISAETGRLIMWYARNEGARWSIASAESTDGYHWTDNGTAFHIGQDLGSNEPPGPAIAAAAASAMQVSGEATGRLVTLMLPGEDYTTTLGWEGRLAAGYWLGERLGSDAASGLRVDSVDVDAGLAWLTLWDAEGTAAVGVATLDADGGLTSERVALFEGSSPVAWAADGGFVMLYAVEDGDVTTIHRATSSDGSSWTEGDVALETGDEWDSLAVEPGSVQALDDGSLRLWYAGSDGEVWRIGSATSTDEGMSWTRDETDRGWAFPPGAPGDWDDSGVRHPYVLSDGEGGDHLWFSGYDGSTWRAGYAWRPDLETDWTRSSDESSDESRPVIDVSGLFHPDGVERPVVTATDDGWMAWYAGLDDDLTRVGRASGLEPDRLSKQFKRPTLGDTLKFVTEKGDEDALAIPLDTFVDGIAFDASDGVTGLSGLYLDSERGLLFAMAKREPFLFVLDVRDDSDGDFVDTNYLDVEAVVYLDTESGLSNSGTRGGLVHDGRLYLLSQAPESIQVLDLDRIADDEWGDMLYDTTIGWLPAPRGIERDMGPDSYTSVGPGALALHPDGQHLFVTNFNANSVTVYDLSLGTTGLLVDEVPLIGENPYDIHITSDGRYAIVANYSGEVDDEGDSSSTLAVLDADPSSPSFLQVLLWIGNK